MLTTFLITQFLFILLLNLGALDVHQGLAVGCHDAEREALLKFKHSLIDPSNRLSSWKGKGCCDWEGVGCHNVTAFVTHLHLPNPHCDYYLTASKLNPSLLKLSHLSYLDLSCSDFQGSQIPKFIGSFKYLRYLNLSYSNFNGIVPSQLGNPWPSRIQHLDLSGNPLGGTLPYVLANMTSLTYLDLSNNELNSSIPSWLGNMTNLTYLDLSENELNSPIPLWLGNMTSLTYLDLSYNELNSTIPLWSGNMTSLSHLDLSHNYLNGLIPLWLGNITSLTHLDLSHNYLNGLIPLWLGNITSLTHLDLSDNELNGSIPASMRSMKKLEYLNLKCNSFIRDEGDVSMGVRECNANNCEMSRRNDLEISGNMIEGVLPSWLGDFKYLRVLDISGNRINGLIPISIGRLSYLEYLDLSFNTLYGTIPQGLGQCKALVHVDLSSNFLHGALSESHLADLSRLEYLDLSYNVVEWNISSNWSPPFQLSWLNMASCKIQSQFPRWIGDQTKLSTLDFSANNMSGELPQCFTSNQLAYINISHNRITGPVPYIYSANFEFIDLSFNLLSGSLVHHDPSAKNDTIGTPVCHQLRFLLVTDLRGNNISGTIHDCWGDSESLMYINLSSNNLSGTIPDCWAALRSLAYINLSSNNLSGTIPLSMGLLSGLAFLKLSNNSLQGLIPPTLSTNTTLKILDLGDNKLVGNIPSNWGENNLQLLRLRGNQLIGSIPPTLCDIDTLQFIDLSLNNLTGAIPHCFGHLLHMQSSNVDEIPSLSNIHDDNTMVDLKGAELEYTTTLKYFVNIDLSYNALTGSIPEEITNLSALIGLNLSHNHLTGNIPNKIGEMTLLESLDLSNNNLSGKIPPSISALTSLVRLNLSYNTLQGEIPSGHQLQVIEDPSMTYIGNPGLCGDPLPNKCRSNHGENQPIQGQEKPHKELKKDNWEKPVLYLVIMSGFATGFWGVVGSLVLKTRFRFAFFQVVGNVADYLYVQVMIRLNRLRNQ